MDIRDVSWTDKWRRSSRCQGGECVEVTRWRPTWQRSSRCDGGQCVEIAWKRASGCNGGECVLVGWCKATASAIAGECVEAALVKSSFWSDSANCVEVGRWVKSEASGPSGECVEAGRCGCPDGQVLVRDSKLGDDSPVLEFTTADWAEFLDSVKRGFLPWCVDINGPDVLMTGPGDPADPGGRSGLLRFTHGEWDAFEAGAMAGEFDDLAATA